jgi:cyclophilin family peptidyl-prolyl cis-trans isomerase/HEAT repeat protein
MTVTIDQIERRLLRLPLVHAFSTPLRLRTALSVVAVALLSLIQGGCATVPVAHPPAAPVITYEQKLSWILRLEDQRVLRDPIVLADGSVPPGSASSARGPLANVPTPRADLAQLLADTDSRIRRRSALAIGRVGLGGGVQPLIAVLAEDPEPEVRQMAAFALGLLHDASATAALRHALGDHSPLVQGRAAEALAALGDTASAPAIGEVVSALVRGGAVSAVAPDDVDETHPPDVDAFRLGVLALGRLKAYDALAASVLGSSGAPLVTWWPVAAAVQRTEDRRALGPLLAMTRGSSQLGRAFAARGLGALKDPSAVGALSTLARSWPGDTRSAISAVKALGQIGDRRAGPVLLELLRAPGLDPLLRIEVVAALGPTHAAGAVDSLLDLVSDNAPAVRAAAFRSLRELDPTSLLSALSSLDADRDSTVRAALASMLGTLDRDAALPRLSAMLQDPDVRVIPPVLAALVKIKAPDIDHVLLEALKQQDVVVRSAAAAGLGSLKPPGGERALLDAFHAAAQDDTYVARAAMLDALLAYGPDVARPALREALSDKDWAVRVHAAALLKPLEPPTDPAAAIRPAPTNRPAGFYESLELVTPAVSPHVFIDTSRGTIEIEMAVLDAPLTCLNFMTLARAGFFKGSTWHRVVPNFVAQDGDPRGDGEGGPGYTIRDEPNERPYLRGTMGMALDWADTGGSQFFLTHSPQPHLDGRYTVFGQIVSGLDVLDHIQPGDAILHVRVWDGKTMSGQ